MTKTEFARECAYLTAHIASWAGDALGPLPDAEVPMEAVERFARGVRERVDAIIAEACPPPPTEVAMIPSVFSDDINWPRCRDYLGNNQGAT